MKLNTIAIILMMSISVIAAVQAEETQNQQGGHQMSGMSGMSMMDEMMSDEKIKKKQEFMLKMHELSSKILSATDQNEKDRLKNEQFAALKAHEKEHMQMMHEHMMKMMQGGGMGNMGGMSGMGGMGGMQHGNTPASPNNAMPSMQH